MDCTICARNDRSTTPMEDDMTALLVLLLLFTALALAAVRWGADTRVSREWHWDDEPASSWPLGTGDADDRSVRSVRCPRHGVPPRCA
jgi:hypothetical protein